jgi:hypothetical protein
MDKQFLSEKDWKFSLFQPQSLLQILSHIYAHGEQ